MKTENFSRNWRTPFSGSAADPANKAYFQSIGDFNHIGGKLKIPTVLLGAEGENFHSSDERVDLKSALEVAHIISEFVSDVLSD